MPEFVVVTFPTSRLVRMDGQPQGLSNQTLTVQAGHHRFDLGAPFDYQPSFQDVIVTGTFFPTPMAIQFMQMGAGAAAAAPATPAPSPPPERRAARRRKPARKAKKAKKKGKKRAKRRTRSAKRRTPRARRRGARRR